MSETRITEPRKRFVEILGQNPRITFSDMRKALVGKKGQPGMNLATLYRIVDAFRDQGLIHEITIAGERVIFPCQCAQSSKDDSITLTFCENCGAVYDEHKKMPPEFTLLETFARVRSCSACVIQG